jgi:hypothetical protein
MHLVDLKLWQFIFAKEMPHRVPSLHFALQGLRLYDANASRLRLEANSEGALLDCCFKDEFVAFAGASDGSIVR